MAEAKTRPTRASVADFLNAVPDETRRKDAKALDKLMRAASGAKPVLWGPSIVGYGAYRYPLSGGRKGESCITGFAVRGREIVVYILLDGVNQEYLLTRLGKHKRGKVCLYF